MRYLPHTPEDLEKMLQAVGVQDLDGLFSTIPDGCKRVDALDIPEMTEWELNDHMAALAGQMVSSADYKMFAGAGSYQHYIPEVTEVRPVAV
mgnify:FL=1